MLTVGLFGSSLGRNISTQLITQRITHLSDRTLLHCCRGNEALCSIKETDMNMIF